MQLNGYEDTGRSLSFKLISDILRKENNASLPIKLEESICYRENDALKSRLTSLLCLDASTVFQTSFGCPTPDTGDLIPWNVSEQFNDREFPKLAGAIIVRIPTHPNYEKMGYGERALKLLKYYYSRNFTKFDETYEDDDSDNDGNMS